MKNLQELGLHHVGFVVKDLDEAIDRFKNLYGYVIEAPYDFKPGKVWSYGKQVSDYCLKIAMLKMGNGTVIELIQPISGDGVHKDFILNGGQGLHHICYAVDDYDTWREYFVKSGNKFVFESETEDETNGYRRCFYAKDEAVGMIYEIKENPYFR